MRGSNDPRLVPYAGYELAVAGGNLTGLLVRDRALHLHHLECMGKADLLAADTGAGNPAFYYSSVADLRTQGKKGVHCSSLFNSLLTVG